MWRDYSQRDNKRIAEWNARAREVRVREICSIIVAAKQGMLEDFWSNHTLGSLVERSLQKNMCKNNMLFSLQPSISKEIFINHQTKK
jgi:transcriptional/translational regulatory protein YebC/TACO1